MCIYVQCVQKPTKSANKKQESDGSKNATHNMVYLYDACDQISDFCHQQLLRKMRISWTDGRTDRGTTVYPSPFGERGYNYDIIAYFLCLASCSEHFISIKHRILATFNINKTNQFELLVSGKGQGGEGLRVVGKS